MHQTLLDCLGAAGKILLRYFGKVTNPREKENASSVVCDADLAAEAAILKLLRRRFPADNIIAEESGRIWRGSDYTWVIDPLDGTSNFVAGLPWFGVQIGILRGGETFLAGMYLPVDDVLYFAAQGKGTYRNGSEVRVTEDQNLRRVLCAFGFDPQPERRTRRMVELLFRVAQAVRNTRTTNSLVDFCYTVDGRFGVCMNMKTKIWDIVPVSLILPEAGGAFSDLAGSPIEFDLGEQAAKREYQVLGASRSLHRAMLKWME